MITDNIVMMEGQLCEAEKEIISIPIIIFSFFVLISCHTISSNTLAQQFQYAF
jgi:hypothetical protein